MSKQKGHPPQDLQALVNDLSARLVKGRALWHEDQKSIKTLTDEIEKLKAIIEDKDKAIANFFELLSKLEGINMKALCRVNHAAKLLSKYQISEEGDRNVERN